MCKFIKSRRGKHIKQNMYHTHCSDLRVLFPETETSGHTYQVNHQKSKKMSPSTRVSVCFIGIKIEGIKIEKGKRTKKEGGVCHGCRKCVQNRRQKENPYHHEGEDQSRSGLLNIDIRVLGIPRHSYYFLRVRSFHYNR